MASVRPFRFSGLPRCTREQVALQHTVAAYLSPAPLRPEFGVSLGEMLERYLKVPCTLRAPELKPVSRAELGTLLPAVACLVVVGVGPGEHKILVDLDLTLVSFTIERLLGGAGGDGRIQRPLTEIEQGVLSFLLLEVLAQFHTGWQSGRELALTLDRFASTLNDVQTIVDAEGCFYMLGIPVALGPHVGHARVLLPQGLVTGVFGSSAGQSSVTAQELSYMRRRLSALGDTTVKARVQIATLDLSSGDLSGLEAGDIVILENHALTKTPNGIEGLAFVRLGEGRNGGLRGRILNDAEQSRLEVVEIVVQEQPLEAAMAQPKDPAEPAAERSETATQVDDNLGETQGLLRDVAAPVVVELGRISMSTAQVTRLRVGQILRLARAPNDPVDLVVHGKLFARGELIEVDGELGVRLTQMVGAS